ncbi:MULTISPECIES: dihydrolipoyl dehydrogenase [Mammaliicoccus]|uniref:Dihydrolipoyl dehydrogenase n=1 Tax=Mammaliicoccus fleurettii TaxID=150056 RepID=A0ABS5MLX8_9STAP|nr:MULTISPECIES: dihydrolipoyl dehydrogenase [Mammaliicoccus]HCN59673.1 dihydrolipoyl dehydrogenase [Staphylococcus sp.]MBL0846169.1 dihydrolipoyl dehydrogenase [Mammaliicoccus fleurettii]MBS3671230.1 dihydrolipoyl dehydrogenase [Mammaliicoccus fleurettii]MBS3696396.1 dihydrolipoyl dehydrogenase [Mammaliicoccus fleurettii]MBW0764076.1 dihydrolipoyl dehydrogenase [Mammaliicoccus fleurettii]
MSKEYDLVILGGGTAGYVSAIRASQLGKKVAIVEKYKIGGTCLHKGCIPTKSYLKTAEILRYINHSNEYGIKTASADFEMTDIVAKKDETVSTMYSGVQSLMKKYKIDIYEGNGTILGPSLFSPQAGTVSVEFENGESELLVNNNVLIATGSRPVELPFLKFNHHTVVSSDDMMQLESLPHNILIIGGGVIGLEFASLLNDLGVEVTVIEAGDSIIPNEQQEISKTIKRSFEENGIKIYEKLPLSEENILVQDNHVEVQIQDSNETFDKVLVAVGRTPNTEELSLNNTKIKTDDKGYIITNDVYQTDDKHIYAVGDVIGNYQLAHVATKEGTIAIEHMFDQNPILLDYLTIPRCIYTNPEVASIGMTEQDAKNENISFKKFKVPFKAIGKSVIENNGLGECILIKDIENEKVLGIHMIGAKVTELINEAALFTFMNGSTEELATTVHAHPSIGEVLMELGLKSENRAIHV